MSCYKNIFTHSINKNFPFRKIKAIFKSTKRRSKFYRFLDKVSFNLCSNVVYKILVW